VPVVDVEALIGLKLQAVVNQPSPVQDEADIRALVAAARGRLNVERLRDYYRLFDRSRSWSACLPAPRDVRLHAVKRDDEPIVGRAVADQTTLRRIRPVRDVETFVAFLRRIRALFGPDDRPRPPTTGDHFRL
jgi:hypothetical protein